MFAEGAFECDAAVHRVGSVISHIFIVVLLAERARGQSVCNLRVGDAAAEGRAGQNWTVPFRMSRHTRCEKGTSFVSIAK